MPRKFRVKMEKNSSQYSSVKAPQSKVGKITVWGVCGVKSVWTGDKTLVVGGLKRVQRCLELQYLRYQERESCSFLHQLLLPARSCFHLLTCFPFFLLLFFLVFSKLQSARQDSRRAGGECVSSDKCHFLTAGSQSAGLGTDVWVLSHHVPRGLESGKNVLSYPKEWALICHEDE